MYSTAEPCGLPILGSLQSIYHCAKHFRCITWFNFHNKLEYRWRNGWERNSNNLPKAKQLLSGQAYKTEYKSWNVLPGDMYRKWRGKWIA